MDSQPLISVIIPAHNSSKTIGIALESMLNQTWKNLEILVIDDNSTDGTQEIVEKLSTHDTRISYHALPFDDPDRVNKRGRNINAGYMARNAGLEKAKGDYITFQDSDDASFLNRIEAQYALLQKYNAVHICVDWMKFDTQNLNKTLHIEAILKERNDIIMYPNQILKLAQKTKGMLIPFLGPLNSYIPFEWKRLRIINKLFFGSLEPYPGTGNSPLFKKEIIPKVQFRKLSDRIWPSFMGRGADRDFNFQVAETFKNSYVFFIPLYMWRQQNQHIRYAEYTQYIV